MSDLWNSLTISAKGMQAQGARMRTISENIANADTTGKTPGAEPYTRRLILFKNEMDKKLGMDVVKVDKIEPDKKTPFVLKYMPDHPAADKDGYVKMPNINTLIEVMDMREAQRSYEANLGMIDQTRAMLSRTIDMLR